MKKEKIMMGMIIVIIVGVAFMITMQYVGRNGSNSISKDTNDDSITVAQNIQNIQSADVYATRSSPGEVTIDITPKGIVNGNVIFEIAVNTHTVDMTEFDLSDITTLTIEGKEYRPISSPALSGHHNNGEIIFAITALPKTFEITITGIPDVEERVFSW